MNFDTLVLQHLGLLAVGVARIGHQMEGVLRQRLRCGFAHRLQAAVVPGLRVDVVRDDDCVLRIDGGLYVVVRPLALEHHRLCVGASRLSRHITSTLRPHSHSSRRDDRTRFK